MKFNNKELWTIYIALNQTAAYYRSIDMKKISKNYEKLANKLEKELLK